MQADLFRLIQTQLADIHAGWSIGSFGAIGEFHQRDNDDLQIDNADQLTRASEKGAIRFEPEMLQRVRAVAYETLSPTPHRWSQGMVFCLPSEQAKMNQRAVLTELGKDSQAIKTGDQDAYLFDMGLGQEQIDFCIRTSDPELLALLRAREGKSLFRAGSPMPAILQKHPHRVVISKLGRVEVFQKIGGPDTGGVSPDGPHTHVLPKLLKTGRTHSANTPVPEGYLPCASLHPASPVMDAQGKDITFDKARYAAFQTLLQTYGREAYKLNKQAVLQACAELRPEDDFATPECRLGRAAVRNTLRQLKRINQWPEGSEQAAWLKSWQGRFDQRAEQDQIEQERVGH